MLQNIDELSLSRAGGSET